MSIVGCEVRCDDDDAARQEESTFDISDDEAEIQVQEETCNEEVSIVGCEVRCDDDDAARQEESTFDISDDEAEIQVQEETCNEEVSMLGCEVRYNDDDAAKQEESTFDISDDEAQEETHNDEKDQAQKEIYITETAILDSKVSCNDDALKSESKEHCIIGISRQNSNEKIKHTSASARSIRTRSISIGFFFIASSWLLSSFLSRKKVPNTRPSFFGWSLKL